MKRTPKLAAALLPIVASAAMAFAGGPASAAEPITAAHADRAGTSTTAVSETLARYTVTVRCHVVRIKDTTVVDVIYGTGTGTTYNSAKLNAEKDANRKVPPGHYKRHCHPV
ncbi:hypothetical protein ABZ749_12375 [Micromonospora sp. NPDC047753]|uniref:hypothetical protein n=1 Tax=Micromonospora sp. NPDC047753 TaxID=3154817 RepID=UPI0034033FEB